MRFSGILSLVSVLGAGVLVTSCGDDKAGAIVNDEVSWYLGCGPNGGCTFYHPHAQTEEGPNFKVKCSRQGNFVSITVTDPGTKADPKTGALALPGSTLVINNASPGALRCDVSVYEAAEADYAGQDTLLGTCADNQCTFTGAFDSNGWDFIGTLQCDGLKKKNASGQSANAVYTLNGAAPGTPVNIAVDNCD